MCLHGVLAPFAIVATACGPGLLAIAPHVALHVATVAVLVAALLS